MEGMTFQEYANSSRRGMSMEETNAATFNLLMQKTLDASCRSFCIVSVWDFNKTASQNRQR